MWLDLLKRRRRWLRGWCFGAFAAVIAAIWLVAAGWVHWPRGTFVRLVVAGVIVLNLAWWVRADLRLTESVERKGRRRWLRGALATYMVLLILPVIGTFLGRLEWADLPLIVASWAQFWHMWLVVMVPVGAVVGGLVGLVGLIRWAVLRDSVPVPDRGRRAFLRQAAVAAPVVLAGGVAVAGRWQLDRFERRRYTISPPGLPERLRGLTITHLSDFHVGRLFRREHLARAIDAANAFDSDIVVVTGDIIDQSNDYLPETVDAMRGLRHRYGLFCCIGNHDLIDDGDAFVRYMRGEGVPLLVNERRVLDVGGESVAIGGLDWAGRGRDSDSMKRYEAYADATFGPPAGRTGAALARASGSGAALPISAGAGKTASPFSVALAHHPHAFDPLAVRGVALTLSGHTHGGQLMLTPPGLPEWGAGPLMFRYIRGFYTAGQPGHGRCPTRQDTVLRSEHPLLFVNSGVGNWFPFRLNAPAEIVQLRLG